MKSRPKKWFGQHFIADRGVARRMVASADIGPADSVLEIGPGTGVLTEALLDAGCRVIAVEIDRELIDDLTSRFGATGRFTIREADILATDPSELLDDGSRVKVVANIPFYITTPIIDYLTVHHRWFSSAVLMMQKEVADRLLAGSGSRRYGLTSLNLALYAEGRKLFNVRPGSFNPPPGVMSQVVELAIAAEPRFPLADERLFRRLTGTVFRKRRKMIRNTLVPFITGYGVSREATEDMIIGCGVALTDRPERIGVEQYVCIANRLSAVLADSAETEEGR